MGRKQINLHLDTDIIATAENLKNMVLQDGDLVFFSNHTASIQSWYRYIFSMGMIKIKENFEEWKRMVEDNEIQDKSRKED